MNRSCGVTSTKTERVPMNSKTKQPTTAAIFPRLRSNRYKMRMGTSIVPTARDEATILSRIPSLEREK